MPLYRCAVREGLTREEQRARIAKEIVRIHCGVTGAPASFVHAFFSESPPEELPDGKVAFVLGSIRWGRTEQQKQGPCGQADSPRGPAQVFEPGDGDPKLLPGSRHRRCAGGERLLSAPSRLCPGLVTDWFVFLVDPAKAGFALGIVRRDHETVPAQAQTPAAGVLLSLEVPDVDAAYSNLLEAGAPIVAPLRNEPWGQRHFLVKAPDGVLLDVISPIPPSAEYASAYVQSP